MTLGGLALAVGILVDDATVEIENTHRNMGMKKPLTRAVLDGAQQIAVPAFVSTLSICIVFVPVLLLTGAAKYPLHAARKAVVFAMLASYLLSRTLIPNMVHYLLRKEVDLYREGEGGNRPKRPAGTGKSTMRSTAGSTIARPLPRHARPALDHRAVFLACSASLCWDRWRLRCHRPRLLSYRRFRPDPVSCAAAAGDQNRGIRRLFRARGSPRPRR